MNTKYLLLSTTIAALAPLSSIAVAFDTKSFASATNVTYEVINNPSIGIGQELQDQCKSSGADWALCNTAKVSFSNNSEQDLPAGMSGWSIYFHSIRQTFDIINTDQLTVEHINGDLHRIVPNINFSGLPAGQTLELELLTEYWQLFQSDFMPRYYIADSDQNTFIFPNTDTESIEDYSKSVTANSAENWKRSSGDNNQLQTAATRFDNYSKTESIATSDVDSMIMPTPSSIIVNSGTADLSQGVVWNVSGISWEESEAAKERLEALGMNFIWWAEGAFSVNVSIDADHISTLGSEYAKTGGYELIVSDNEAKIIGFDNVGAFYGLQSIASLMPSDFSQRQTLSKVMVTDAPRYDYRGVHVDVGRNFHSKEVVLRLLDQMAAYKLNKFHIHLSDDEGWRIEIPGIPELTDIGSKRCHDLTEKTCLLPQLGSGPDSDNSGTGFYSKSDYIEIVRYAKERNIQVIPELDMPAHVRAAVVAMEARYEKYMEEGNSYQANLYRLIDPLDTSNYTSVQFYNDSYLNPCENSTYTFIDKVMQELVLMHNDAGQPIEIWNLGGDEAKNIYEGPGFEDINEPNPVPWKGVIDKSLQDQPWAKSPSCQNLMAEENLTLDDVAPYFVKRVSALAASHDMTGIAAWQDGMKGIENANELATDSAYVNEWDTLYWGGNSAANDLLAKNFKVIQSHPDFLYFDFPYEVDPSERGYYWATRATDTQKVFSFAPQNLPQNSETAVDRDGNHWTDNSDGDASTNGGYIGMQAQLWSETIRTDEQLEYMAYPRVLAVAERAWHKAEWENNYSQGTTYSGTTNLVNKPALAVDWEKFANLLGQKELSKIDAFGVDYRVPVPGAKIVDGKLEALVPFPGLPIEYQDSKGTWHSYESSNKPASAQAVRALSADGSRIGRSVTVE